MKRKYAWSCVVGRLRAGPYSTSLGLIGVDHRYCFLGASFEPEPVSDQLGLDAKTSYVPCYIFFYAKLSVRVCLFLR